MNYSYNFRKQMVDKNQIDELVEQIPAIPALLKACEGELLAGNLSKAAKIASDDLAFITYLQTLINSPAYGLKGNIKDTSQIFSLLGVDDMLNILSSYLVALSAPEKWLVFNINNRKFSNLQAGFLSNWFKVLSAIGIKNREIFRAVTLVPAAICVCDKIFGSHLNTLELVLRTGGLSYNEILKREINTNIFEIIGIIAKKWGFSEEIIKIFTDLDKQNDEISIYIILLISYELSLPEYSSAGFGELFEYEVRASEEQMRVFLEAVNYED